MARLADANLSERILDVTYDLVCEQGIHAVTLRAVAILAKTTTPTVYARFATKEDLLLALANRVRNEFAAEIMRQPTLHKAAQRYLDHAIEKPHDYKLIHEVGWPKLFLKESDQPGLTWVREHFAELYGGAPKDYVLIAHCLWMELHGGASFISRAPAAEVSKRYYKSCLRSCDIMIENARLFVVKS